MVSENRTLTSSHGEAVIQKFDKEIKFLIPSCQPACSCSTIKTVGSRTLRRNGPRKVRRMFSVSSFKDERW